MAADLVLASASPRRADLLRQIGLPFTVQPADVDETATGTAAERAHAVAVRKADAVAGARGATNVTVLAADTVVAAPDGGILGKPRDATEAAAFLTRLAGATHDVVTGVAVVRGAARFATVAAARVTVAPLAADAIAAYVATGEPLDKAGAYGLQGRAGAFVTHVAGEPSTVVGLPLATTVAALRRVGHPLPPHFAGVPPP